MREKENIDELGAMYFGVCLMYHVDDFSGTHDPPDHMIEYSMYYKRGHVSRCWVKVSNIFLPVTPLRQV